jgi:branched-chain amino acid transport system ATP-binding protein
MQHQAHSNAVSPSGDILSVNNIELVYDGAILVLKGVSLSVKHGGLVALLGANGAGKTSTLKAISRLVQAERGELTRGTIAFDSEDTGTLPPDALVRRGCVQVMEGRRCFGHLTIEENLLTGAYTRRDGISAVRADLERIYTFFPRLRERRRSQAGYTSGGEQQMCAIGRALMSKPKMILLDEPSMGLAPRVVEEIFEIVASLNAELGISYLVAEQNALIALKYAQHGYVMENGRVVLEGTAEELRSNDDIREFYLGVSGNDRVSFRDTKSYSRRKRWLG